MIVRHSIAACLLALTALPIVGRGDEAADPARAALEKQRCPVPSHFAIVWSFGYGGDTMPKDDAAFEKLVAKIKEGGFNTIHCTVTDARLAACRKHGVKIMVDLLAASENSHVYKTPAEAEALCRKLRDEEAIWGYNTWNERFGKQGAGRMRDYVNVRSWDPNHPCYCGTYRVEHIRYLANCDIAGYYDYHWDRGTAQHFPHLLAYWTLARDNKIGFGRWVEGGPGRPGQDFVGRGLYTANTSIACGLKAMLYFLATGYLDEAGAWTPAGRDVMQVNAQLAPLAAEIMKLGNPLAIHSTKITRTLANEEMPQPALPPGLDGREFPEGFWLKPAGGEFVAGIFAYPSAKHAVFVANHNAYAKQDVVLALGADAGKPSIFDRAAGWKPLPVEGGSIRFTLPPGGGELLRFE